MPKEVWDKNEGGALDLMEGVTDIANEKEIMKALNNSAGFVRRELGARVKLRHTPQISFVFDNSIEHGAKMLKIIGSLDIPEEKPEDDEE